MIVRPTIDHEMKEKIMNETFGARLATEAEARKMQEEALRYKHAALEQAIQPIPLTPVTEPSLRQRLLVLEDRVADNGKTTQDLMNLIFEKLNALEKAVGL